MRRRQLRNCISCECDFRDTDLVLISLDFSKDCCLPDKRDSGEWRMKALGILGHVESTVMAEGKSKIACRQISTGAQVL